MAGLKQRVTRAQNELSAAEVGYKSAIQERGTFKTLFPGSNSAQPHVIAAKRLLRRAREKEAKAQVDVGVAERRHTTGWIGTVIKFIKGE